MSERCAICSYEPLLGRFCPDCGTERSPRPPRAPNRGDPFVGRLVAGRYEVGELISVGGMGRVHRGVQRSLDRAIAIKFIHPHLTTSPDAVTRFMNEARAASRLNHPNVVSVFDFGQTSPDEGNDLFIVMELLSGCDLATLQIRESTLPIPRAVDIVRQALLAIAEAHAAGIVHRDMKPENVFVTRQADEDHVKVIDFGLASVHASRRITREGHAMGTPAFMAPEQVRGQLAGPRADQYALGVVLFEMLTGVLPFDSESPLELMQQHLFAPRPDPRAIAPDRGIPEPLAVVCQRAMAIDPSHRFTDAREMCRALVAAVDRRGTVSIGRSAPPPPSIHPRRTERFETLDDDIPTRSKPVSHAVWRPDTFSEVREKLLGDDSRHGVVLVGRAGVGCSYLARAVAGSIDDAVVVYASVPQPPRCTVSGSGLDGVLGAVSALLDGKRDVTDSRPRGEGAYRASDDSEILARALQRLARERGRRVVLVIDDVDRMDTRSARALRDLANSTPETTLRVLMTCERLPYGLDGAFTTVAMRGLSRLAAEVALRRTATNASLVRDDDDIEALYLEELVRWVGSSEAPPPVALADLLEARIQTLSARERLALQSVAITGGGSIAEAAAALGDDAEFEKALPGLEARGFVVRHAAEIRVAHALVARVVLSTTPGGALEALHSRAADRADDTNAAIELRVHHGLRGRGDLTAFLQAERAATARAADKDTDGAISLLAEALHVARIRLAHGEAEAAESAATVFARKLGELLLREGRVDEAHGVVTEAVSGCDPRSPARNELLELSKAIARQRGRTRGFENDGSTPIARVAITTTHAYTSRETTER